MTERMDEEQTFLQEQRAGVRTVVHAFCSVFVGAVLCILALAMAWPK